MRHVSRASIEQLKDKTAEPAEYFKDNETSTSERQGVKTIPTCPVTSWEYGYRSSQDSANIYTVYCRGWAHRDVLKSREKNQSGELNLAYSCLTNESTIRDPVPTAEEEKAVAKLLKNRAFITFIKRNDSLILIGLFLTLVAAVSFYLVQKQKPRQL